MKAATVVEHFANVANIAPRDEPCGTSLRTVDSLPLKSQIPNLKSLFSV
jgi:hypothetical protein